MVAGIPLTTARRRVVFRCLKMERIARIFDTLNGDRRMSVSATKQVPACHAVQKKQNKNRIFNEGIHVIRDNSNRIAVPGQDEFAFIRLFRHRIKAFKSTG